MSTPKSVQPAQSVGTESAIGMEPAASLDEAIQDALGRKLRESWEEVVNEKVPDMFKDLLDKLKNAETGDKGREG